MVHFAMVAEWSDAVAVTVFAWVAYDFVGFDSESLHSITGLNSTNSIPNLVPNFGCVPYQYSVNDNNFNQNQFFTIIFLVFLPDFDSLLLTESGFCDSFLILSAEYLRK